MGDTESPDVCGQKHKKNITNRKFHVSQVTVTCSGLHAFYVSPQPHDNSFWRSKISRRWYGGRNTAPSSSARTVSPERRPDEHESASSSGIDPLNDGASLYDASPLYEDHDIIDYDSDESMSDCASDNNASSPPSSPVSVFSSVFDHFHGSGLATATSVSSSPCGENKGVLSHANRQCFVDTLYLF